MAATEPDRAAGDRGEDAMTLLPKIFNPLFVAAFPIRFTGDLPLWVVLLLVAAAVTAVLLLYQRESKTLASPYNVLLPSLRATAVAMTVLILAGPVWHRRQVFGTLGRVVFAVDTSRSMSLSDSQMGADSANRLQRASDWLLGSATRPGWLETLSKTHDVDVVAFSNGEPVSVWSSGSDSEIPVALDWDADGDSTNLSRPLQSVLSSLNLNNASGSGNDPLTAGDNDSIRRSSIVLMTDGRDTSDGKQFSESPTLLAKKLEQTGTAVNTLGLGSLDEPPDVGIVEVIRPSTVAAEGKLAGKVIVKQFGGEGQPVTVRIESEGETVWQKQLQIADTGRRTVPFEIDVERLVRAARENAPRGIDRINQVLQLVAKVESASGNSSANDFSSENNQVPFRVAASTRNRRLLIVDSSSRWETRYLKNLFVRDPAWNADVVLFGPGTDSSRIQRGSDAGQFPDSASAMAKYDAVLLGDVDASQFNTEDRRRLVRFVAGGGGLIMIDGRFGNLKSMARGEFAELMPVRYLPETSTTVPSRLAATTDGLEQPALGLIDQAEQLESFWRVLPAPRWTARTEVTEGAEVWAETIIGGDRRLPWLATRMYGAGRVFYLASDQTWRWRYKVADRFHVRFWNQLVIAAMEPPYSASDQFVSLGTDKVEYSDGEPIRIRARVRDTLGNPVSNATVDALITKDSGVVAVIPLAVDNSTRGTYAGSAASLPTGAYSIRLRVSGFDESALLADTPIWVVSGDNAEMQRISLDDSSLRQIATAGGGQYVHESDAQQLLETLKPLSSGTVVETDFVLWQSYLWFWAIIALLAVEWWCRKRAGLV